MRNRIGLLVLILLSIGLTVALVLTSKRASERERLDTDKIGTLSNRWVETTSSLEEQRNVAALLQQDLQNAKSTLTDLTNSYALLSATLAQTNAVLAQVEAARLATVEEVKKRDARIAELQGQNEELDKQAITLGTQLTNLTAQISETQRKLAASEGDKAFLQKELKRLMTEKAELERQFNDLAVLRAQVSRLKEELSIARRIEWIRRGLLAGDDAKGAAKLMQKAPLKTPPSAKTNATDLNVEVSSEGTVKILAPTNAPTTAPGTNAP